MPGKLPCLGDTVYVKVWGAKYTYEVTEVNGRGASAMATLAPENDEARRDGRIAKTRLKGLVLVDSGGGSGAGSRRSRKRSI